MTLSEAQSLLKAAVNGQNGHWADIGAGTGTFTLALQGLLQAGTIYAVDKNPHVLWSLVSTDAVKIEVVEGNFNQALDLPMLDGMIMANALHYSDQPLMVLDNLLDYLNPGAPFILIEYETRHARSPWVPHPIPFLSFQRIAGDSRLTKPQKIGKIPSRYGHEHIYSAFSRKL